MQTETNRKGALLTLIAREFGIKMNEMKVEKDKLTTQDRAELASAIARQSGIPEEECDWEMVAY